MAAIWSPDSVEPGEAENSIKQANEMKGQRILKTHLSVDMLPKQVMEKKAKALLFFFFSVPLRCACVYIR